MAGKPIKRIALVDAGEKAEILRAVLPFIEDQYELEITQDENADYVFHSCFGYDVLNYSGVRIFVTGECITPDFNICDYALAFDPITFGDRYIRLPLIRLFPDAYQSLCSQRPDPASVLESKDGFCAYVMSNTKHSAPERSSLFDALSAYKPVASGGKWRNNVGGPVADKIAFQSTYKFVLALENAAYPGYLTEKFAQAAQSNAVPIYWGDPSITEVINPKAFINVQSFATTEALVDHIRELDQNDERYKAMLAEPWFHNGTEPDAWKTETYRRFLCHIFDQPHAAAYRRNRSRWGLKREKQVYRMAHQPIRQIGYLIRNALR